CHWPHGHSPARRVPRWPRSVFQSHGTRKVGRSSPERPAHRKMLHFNQIITGLLVALAARVIHAQDAAPALRVVAAPAAANADEARVQQYVQLLQPTMWRELDFVRQVCDLTPQQRPKAKAADTPGVTESDNSKLMQPIRQMTTPAARDV